MSNSFAVHNCCRYSRPRLPAPPRRPWDLRLRRRRLLPRLRLRGRPLPPLPLHRHPSRRPSRSRLSVLPRHLRRDSTPSPRTPRGSLEAREIATFRSAPDRSLEPFRSIIFARGRRFHPGAETSTARRLQPGNPDLRGKECTAAFAGKPQHDSEWGGRELYMAIAKGGGVNADANDAAQPDDGVGAGEVPVYIWVPC